MSGALLELRGFGVAFGERVVLVEVDLDVPERGVTVLLGPVAAGKSTLLRTIAGANDGNPWLRTWGEARYAGAPLDGGERPTLMGQDARLLVGTVFEHIASAMPERSSLTGIEQRARAAAVLEEAGLAELSGSLAAPVASLRPVVQRRLALARALARRARLVCVDEPTAGLGDAEAEALMALLLRHAEDRSVLLVTHNQRHARNAGGTAALLAGGRIVEHRATAELFHAPRSEAARQFVRTGSCAVPSPGARVEELSEDTPPPPPLPRAAVAPVPAGAGPRGFHWLDPARLGGTPRPGLLGDRDEDLAALRRAGVTVLITLEEQPLDARGLAMHGLRGGFFPIPDMRAPTVEAARAHCAEVAALVAAGEVVALHCRAGAGRTGTMLAAQRIFAGASALEALEAARRVEPLWVQSEEQLDFLETFARALSAPRSPENEGPQVTDALRNHPHRVDETGVRK